jgi:hypothetical protein
LGEKGIDPTFQTEGGASGGHQLAAVFDIESTPEEITVDIGVAAK